MPLTVTADPSPDERGGRVYGCEVWATYSRRYGDRWSREVPARRIPPADWWPYVHSLCQGGRRVVLIAPNGSQMLTLTSFWSAVDHGLFRVLEQRPGTASRGKTAGQTLRPWLGRLVLKGIPTIVGARTDGGSLTVLSAGNYAEVPPRELCRSVGVTGPVVEGIDQGDGPLIVEEDTYAFALTRWFRGLISRWVAERCGPWGDTAGALSLSLWRAVDGKRACSRHDNEEALKLEAKSLHGGRAAVWYYGEVGSRRSCPPPPADPPPGPGYPRIKGQAHKVDVRSMYPWILGHRPFPVQFKGIRRNLTPGELAGYLRHWGGIADVTITATEPEYPFRYKNRTRYPVGTFRTVLAGPELDAALLRGEIREVHTYLRYQLGNPFRNWSRFVLRKRAECRASADHPGELLWKLVANAFGGKFAQKKRRWVPMPKEPCPIRWGEYLYCSADGEPPQRRRALAGIPHRLEVGSPGGRQPASVFAYLTSYGRLYMRGIRSVLGPGVVLSQDTDGLWLTDAGLELAREAGLLAGDGPGTLRHDESVSYARWWDARHYYSGGKWTLAGVASGWQLTGTARVKERRLMEPTAWGQAPDQGVLLEWVSSRRLDGIRPDVPVDGRGWARWHYPDGKAVGAKMSKGDRGEGEMPTPPKRKPKRRPGPSLLDI